MLELPFVIESPFVPMGDQPAAIEAIVKGFVEEGKKHQILMGVTGSGKTFTMAHVAARLGRPVLVISHNKTLAAQLYEEMKELFPKNAVSYFVSYYDYYQPEAYIPQRDIYIEKDAARNDDLDRLRLAATSSLVSRTDVIVVASVSCIFGLGSPDEYKKMVIGITKGAAFSGLGMMTGEERERRAAEGGANDDGGGRDARVTGGQPEGCTTNDGATNGRPTGASAPLDRPVRAPAPQGRDELLKALIDLQYERNDIEFKRGAFRVRGDVVEIFPAYETTAYRVEFFGDVVENIWHINPLTGEMLMEEKMVFIYPAKHHITDEANLQRAVKDIRAELEERVKQLKMQGKLLEAQRLLARTKYDCEMMVETGFCSGIENYSRHIANQQPGAKPNTLMDYFPKDYLLIIDESHVTLPQVQAMYAGDRNRKEVLVDHGFRLPSALDNRPMRFEEFMAMWNQVLFVSATPAKLELGLTGGEVVEQVIRPTGLIDPKITVRPATGQVQDLLIETRKRADLGQRTLVTALTKRLSEDLAHYLEQAGLRCKYLHSEIQTFDRVEILRELREGTFDVLVGVNLLREGLDLPEVSMVAILDADKEGFLRSETSLIQMIGRCARNSEAQVYLYADKITPSMKRAMDETTRRRAIQEAYNVEHGVTPTTIVKAIRHGIDVELKARRVAREMVARSEQQYDQVELIRMLEEEMLQAANNLEFEKAAAIRDRLREIKNAPQIRETGEAQRHKGTEALRDGALADAIHDGIGARLAERKPMTPQQKKVKKPQKRR